MVPDPVVFIALSNLPKHVAIIMDGNGRWAEGSGKPRTVGHQYGTDAVRTAVRTCRRLGISALTLYAFSEQNWLRPVDEVETLMRLLAESLLEERKEILDNKIRLRAIGRVDRLPPSVRELLNALTTESAHHEGMTLSLALSYGGREELLDATKHVAKLVKMGALDPDKLTEDGFAAHLPSMEVGPVDLLIRTGGEQRISNFLLWSIAYAELHFSECMWPDFNENNLFEAIRAYQQRDRRFGLVAPRIPYPRAMDDAAPSAINNDVKHSLASA